MSGSDFDVVIVGAGMVGASLAQILAQANFNVALLERSELRADWTEKEHDIRVSALNLGSQRMLSAIGVWAGIENRRISHYTHMYVWDAGSHASIEFDCADFGLKHLGTIAENGLVTYALHEQLVAAGNIEVLPRTELEHVCHDGNGVKLKLSDNRSLHGRVLVGADGSESTVRRLLGIKSNIKSFDQTAIVAQVRTERDHEKTAWQRFLHTGPLAFLPLSNGDCSIVWSCEQGLVNELMQLGDADFARRLAEAFQSKLGAVTQVGPRKTFTLSSAQVIRYVDYRCALIGDAAHVVHPLAGQGVNLGMADAAALAQVLVDARLQNKDIGGQLTLRRYERWRKGENLLMGYALAGMKRLFGTRSSPIAKLRGVGLRLVDMTAPLKYAFAGKAMGLSGELPKIMDWRALED